ncbi:hypothetical protein J6590_035458 [Homalodisca vitripennis]|nr:hypothetical protein J6590_035458 [Homalodisca vitripennis]
MFIPLVEALNENGVRAMLGGRSLAVCKKGKKILDLCWTANSLSRYPECLRQAQGPLKTAKLQLIQPLFYYYPAHGNSILSGDIERIKKLQNSAIRERLTYRLTAKYRHDRKLHFPRVTRKIGRRSFSFFCPTEKRSRVEWSGEERRGEERRGVEWSGVERRGEERRGEERRGVERRGEERRGEERRGGRRERRGEERRGEEWSERDVGRYSCDRRSTNVCKADSLRQYIAHDNLPVSRRQARSYLLTPRRTEPC